MRWNTILILSIAACLMVDSFPHFGPPQFRYTGSDPNTHIWNLGWPLATALILVVGLWTVSLAYLDRPSRRSTALAGSMLGAIVVTHGSELYTRVAGLIFTGYPGAPKSTRQLQASSSLFYEVFAKYDAGNMLLTQAQAEVLSQELDIRRTSPPR